MMKVNYNGKTYQVFVDIDGMTVKSMRVLAGQRPNQIPRRVRLSGPTAAKVANSSGLKVPETE